LQQEVERGCLIIIPLAPSKAKNAAAGAYIIDLKREYLNTMQAHGRVLNSAVRN